MVATCGTNFRGSLAPVPASLDSRPRPGAPIGTFLTLGLHRKLRQKLPGICSPWERLENAALGPQLGDSLDEVERLIDVGRQ